MKKDVLGTVHTYDEYVELWFPYAAPDVTRRTGEALPPPVIQDHGANISFVLAAALPEC